MAGFPKCLSYVICIIDGSAMLSYLPMIITGTALYHKKNQVERLDNIQGSTNHSATNQHFDMNVYGAIIQ